MRRRRLLALIAALPLWRPAPLRAAPDAGLALVDGWVLTARDRAELARLAR